MKIVTDCAADMPAEELERLGVHTGPGIVGAALVPMEWMGDLVG